MGYWGELPALALAGPTCPCLASLPPYCMGTSEVVGTLPHPTPPPRAASKACCWPVAIPASSCSLVMGVPRAMLTSAAGPNRVVPFRPLSAALVYTCRWGWTSPAALLSFHLPAAFAALEVAPLASLLLEGGTLLGPPVVCWLAAPSLGAPPGGVPPSPLAGGLAALICCGTASTLLLFAGLPGIVCRKRSCCSCATGTCY